MVLTTIADRGDKIKTSIIWALVVALNYYGVSCEFRRYPVSKKRLDFKRMLDDTDFLTLQALSATLPISTA